MTARSAAVLIRVEAFGRVLHVEYGKDEPQPERDAPPHEMATPMITYADDRHEYARDYVGFVSRHGDT